MSSIVRTALSFLYATANKSDHKVNIFIDEKLKSEICFGETLVISCGHFEGDRGEESSDSEWSCEDASESEISELIKKDTIIETKERIEEDVEEEQEPEEDNDFHLYFFPDCTKLPLSRDSKASVLTVDGIPKVNPAAKDNLNCICEKDKSGKCVCYIKLPCKCGAKTAIECTCSKAVDICICLDDLPQPVCTCKGSNVCLCHPGGIQTVCTCDKINKPCLCHPRKFPSPVCLCKHKPIFGLQFTKSEEKVGENDDANESIVNEANVQQPCECQKPDPVLRCLCRKGKECMCRQDACVCDIQRPCICEPMASNDEICKLESLKSLCSCPILQECTYDTQSINDCKCFPNSKNCNCSDTDLENCKCFKICDCTDPCICDTVIKEEKECICLDREKQAVAGLICSCPNKDEKPKTIKRVRAGKHGYRWCHDVDSKHTYFDYGYGRHDKISHKETKEEKIQILGLHEEIKKVVVCPLHYVQAPPYKKQHRKQSLDCCSALGGMNIYILQYCNKKTVKENAQFFFAIQVSVYALKLWVRIKTNFSFKWCHIRLKKEQKLVPNLSVF